MEGRIGEKVDFVANEEGRGRGGTLSRSEERRPVATKDLLVRKIWYKTKHIIRRLFA